jgi:hypothetical protein
MLSLSFYFIGKTLSFNPYEKPFLADEYQAFDPP